MMSKDLHNFFNVFGTEVSGIDLPVSNTIEQNALLWAKHFNNNTKPGHGSFFDFEATPELEKPALDCLIKNYGWNLEKPFFIRKPECSINNF